MPKIGLNGYRKYSQIVESRYLVYTKDLHKDEETLMVPVYMTMFL